MGSYKEELIAVLKGEDNFAAASAVVGRAEAVVEVEELTSYPVPRTDMAKRIDEYRIRCETDEVIQERKTVIGNELMRKAWATDLETVDGWGDLAGRFPEARVFAVCREEKDFKEFALCAKGNTMTASETEPVTVAALNEGLETGRRVRYKKNNGYYIPDGVYMQQDPDAKVVIGLKKIMN